MTGAAGETAGGGPRHVWPSIRIAEALEEEYGSAASPDSPLPSERALAQRFDVQRPTIRVALEYLAQRGVIYRRERSGWFVNPPRWEYNPLLPPSVPDERRRVEVVTTDADGQPRSPRPGLAFLALRQYFLDGRLAVAEHIYLRPDLVECLGGADLTARIPEFWAHISEHCGVNVTAERLTLVPAVAGPDLAPVLGMSSREPILDLNRLYFSGEELIGIDLEHWRSDVMTITIDNPIFVGPGRAAAAGRSTKRGARSSRR